MASDMVEMFRDLKAERKKLRAQRLAGASAADDGGWKKHTLYHWSRMLDGHRLDYWPSAGKWRYRQTFIYGLPVDVLGFIAKRSKGEAS